MEPTNRSGKGLCKAIVPFYPKQRILYFSLCLPIISLSVQMELELIPPQSPLSVVIGIIRILFGSGVSYRLIRKLSHSSIFGIACMPKSFPLLSLIKSLLILELATIFMAFVIFSMLRTAFILSLIAFSDAEKKTAGLERIDLRVVLSIITEKTKPKNYT